MTRTEDDQMAVLGNFASPVDIAAYGEYRVTRRPGDDRPLYRFTGRITADGSSGFRAEPGRYHLYAGWFCPWSQRTTIQRQLNGLDDVISVSYVDDRRDGRGWAFRDHRGPDPVNGFRLLREAYEATEAGFDGHVSVPTLWDRATGRIVSNDYRFIGIDLATQFGHWSNGADTFPSDRLDEIDELDDWLGPVVNRGVGAAAGSGPAAEIARANLHGALADLDVQLAGRRYLLGRQITEPDVRLWVSLVRYGSGAGHPLAEFPNVWDYARDLYQQPAFRATTDFTAFTPTGSRRPDWHAPHQRARLDNVRREVAPR